MLVALSQALARAERYAAHHVRLDPLSTRERMSQILQRISAGGDQFVAFASLFTAEEGKAGVVVTFTAVLQLLTEHLIEVVQGEEFAPIHIKGVD
jgi:segregation and condensation protein A